MTLVAIVMFEKDGLIKELPWSNCMSECTHTTPFLNELFVFSHKIRDKRIFGVSLYGLLICLSKDSFVISM